MPTYIDGEIPVGSVQSGELVLRNVVIETAVPYKPPVDGGIRSGIRDEYVPDGTERMILFDGNMQLMTADVEDGKKFLADGWQLVGMFDRDSAERIAEKIASNPPPDNRVMMAKKNQKRLFGMGVLATMLPVAKMNLLAQREIKLEQKIALGMAKPAEPAKDAVLAKAVSAEAAKAQTTAATIAQQISNTLAEPPPASADYINTYVLAPQGAQTGGAMASFFGNVRLPNGQLVRVDSIPKDLYQHIYVYPPYNPMDAGRSLGRQILLVARSQRFPDTTYTNLIFQRVNEWNASNPVKLVTSTFGNDRPV